MSTTVFVGIYVPYYFLPTYAVSAGLSKSQGAILLSVVGLSTGVGRIVAGYISNKEWANHIKIHSNLVVAGGVCTVIAPAINSFHILICCATGFGIATGECLIRKGRIRNSVEHFLSQLRLLAIASMVRNHTDITLTRNELDQHMNVKDISCGLV